LIDSIQKKGEEIQLKFEVIQVFKFEKGKKKKLLPKRFW